MFNKMNKSDVNVNYIQHKRRKIAMWIKWLLLGILGWLILGFAAFVIMVKVDGDTEVDKEIKQLFGWCL